MRSADLAIIIPYPTSASGIIVLLKTPPKYRKVDYDKNKKAQKKHAYARHFCRSWYNGSYTMMAKPMKTLELHYPMIQFLITIIVTWLRGFQDKLLYLMLFSMYPSLLWELRDKRNLITQFWLESLGAMLEYWYIKRDLFWSKVMTSEVEQGTSRPVTGGTGVNELSWCWKIL